LAELTMPDVPIAGLVGVFWLGFKLESATDAEVVGPVVPSCREVASSPLLSLPEATSRAGDWAPQEYTTPTTNPTKTTESIFLKIHSPGEINHQTKR
jgi:hypothetical protein